MEELLKTTEGTNHTAKLIKNNQDLEGNKKAKSRKEEIVMFYTNANDLSSIQHHEESVYLIEDLKDSEEQAQLISDIASTGQVYTQNGTYFRGHT